MLLEDWGKAGADEVAAINQTGESLSLQETFVSPASFVELAWKPGTSLEDLKKRQK